MSEVVSKVVIEVNPKPTGFDKIAWSAIGVDPEPTKGDIATQVPDGWSNTSSPQMEEDYPNEPPYPIVP
jgi:hypothetical protein